MSVEWTYFWPAVRHLRFWRTAVSLLAKGALTGALMYSLTLGIGTFVDKIRGVPDGEGFLGWVGGQTGSSWFLLLSAYGIVGLVFYAARRLWTAEQDGDLVDVLRRTSVDLGNGHQLTGLSAFAEFGQVFETTHFGTDWFHTIEGSYTQKYPGLSRDSKQRLRAFLAGVLRELWRRELIAGEDTRYHSLEENQFTLTPRGSLELQRAQAAERRVTSRP